MQTSDSYMKYYWGHPPSARIDQGKNMRAVTTHQGSGTRASRRASPHTTPASHPCAYSIRWTKSDGWQGITYLNLSPIIIETKIKCTQLAYNLLRYAVSDWIKATNITCNLKIVSSAVSNHRFWHRYVLIQGWKTETQISFHRTLNQS